MAGGISSTCHWPPTICGAGDETACQPCEARSVQNCSIKSALVSGHDKVMFAPVNRALISGGAETVQPGTATLSNVAAHKLELSWLVTARPA